MLYVLLEITLDLATRAIETPLRSSMGTMCWNDPKDFAKPVKAISLPQDVPSTSECRLNELEDQVQCLMEAHLAPNSSNQVKKSLLHARYVVVPTTLSIAWKISSKLLLITHLHTDKAGCKWYTFKPEQNNLGDTYNPS
nr:hypothetical protein [Tanacetum cinerariifolium]